MDFNVLGKGNLAKLEVELAQQKADKKSSIKEAIEGPVKGVEKANKAVRKAMADEPVAPKAKTITAKDVKTLHKAVDEAEAKKELPKRMKVYEKVIAYKTKFPECLRGQPSVERAFEQYAEINSYFSASGSESLARITLVEGFTYFELFAKEVGLLSALQLKPGFSAVLAEVVSTKPELLEPELTQFQVELGGFKMHWIPRGLGKIRAMWSEWSYTSQQ
jgi:hypothetical protein